MAKSKINTPATRILAKAGIVFKVHPYPYMERGGTHTSSLALGVPEHNVIKTLIFETLKADGERYVPMVVLMHGDKQVSKRALARFSAAHRARVCVPATAERYTGYRVGGTSPFGMRRPMRIVIPATALELPRLYINAGRRGLLQSLAPADLEFVLDLQIANMAACWRLLSGHNRGHSTLPKSLDISQGEWIDPYAAASEADSITDARHFVTLHPHRFVARWAIEVLLRLDAMTIAPNNLDRAYVAVVFFTCVLNDAQLPLLQPESAADVTTQHNSARFVLVLAQGLTPVERLTTLAVRAGTLAVRQPGQQRSRGGERIPIGYRMCLRPSTTICSQSTLVAGRPATSSSTAWLVSIRGFNVNTRAEGNAKNCSAPSAALDDGTKCTLFSRGIAGLIAINSPSSIQCNLR